MFVCCEDNTCIFNQDNMCTKDYIDLELHSRLDTCWNQCVSYEKKEELEWK